MDAASRRHSGINLGFMAPLTPFRHFVMGEESMGRAANPEETTKIAGLLREAVSAGAFGFTTTVLAQHIGYQGHPLACRMASRDELKSYGNVLRDLGKGSIEIALTKRAGRVMEDEYELLEFMLTHSQRPVTFLAMAVNPKRPEAPGQTLDMLEPLLKRGAKPQITCRPLVVQIDLRNPFSFADMDTWNRVFNQPVEVQKQILLRSAPFATLSARNSRSRTCSMANGIGSRFWRWQIRHSRGWSAKPWPRLPRNAARTRSIPSWTSGSRTTSTPVHDGQFHEEGIAELVKDPRTMIGLSDGGAHVDMLCDAGYCTYLLGKWVRERQAVTLEFAIKRITSEPADFFGVKERGRLLPGMAADFAIFDYNTVDSAKRAEMRTDLPGGGRRLVMTAQGIEYTIVNGKVLYEHRNHTGDLPGQVLRS